MIQRCFSGFRNFLCIVGKTIRRSLHGERSPVPPNPGGSSIWCLGFSAVVKGRRKWYWACEKCSYRGPGMCRGVDNKYWRSPL